MTSSSKLTFISAEQYLAAEEHAACRHEYVDGLVFAMTGGTRRHNLIAQNICFRLREHLRGGSCRAYIEAVKARVEATNSFYYPDVMVACDKFDKKSVFTAYPVLIVEVLSPATAATDRREKAFAYKQIETLQEYLIVHQSRKRVELHRKDQQGHWEISEFGAGSEFMLDSMPAGPFKLSMEHIYEDIDMDQSDELVVHEDAEDEWNQEESEVDC